METKAFGTYEIGEICHVAPATVRNWIEKGLIPTFTTGGGHRRVWAADLVKFLKEHNIPVPSGLLESKPLRILVVDDETPIRRIIRRILNRLFPDAELEEAADGFEAGKLVANIVPSLIILDLRLPGVDGFNVCRNIRQDEALKNVKILAVSGHNHIEWGRQALQAGADGFLGKPFTADELRQKVFSLLGNSRRNLAASPES